MAKKSMKHSLGSKYHSSIERKRTLSVKLPSGVGSPTCTNHLGQQAVTMIDEFRSSLTSLESAQSQVKENIDGGYKMEQMPSYGKNNSLFAAKAAKAAAKATAAFEGQSNSSSVLPEIVPFHQFATKREKVSVKVAVVDWKNRRGADVRSTYFSSFPSEKAQIAFHESVQKVNEWSLDLINTCENNDSLEDARFGVNEDFISPTTTSGTSGTGVTDNEQRMSQLQNSESDQTDCFKVESSSQDFTNDLSVVKNKGSLRDFLDQEFEDRSICGPECMVECRTSSLESSSVQGQPLTGALQLTPKMKLEFVKTTHDHSEENLGLKSMRTSYDNISSENIRSAVLDYVVNLLTPLYKTRKIQKDGFKLIVKKAVAKVMERESPQRAVSEVGEFLNSRRKTKIRALVDRYIEMHMSPPQSRGGVSIVS